MADILAVSLVDRESSFSSIKAWSRDVKHSLILDKSPLLDNSHLHKDITFTWSFE